LVKLTAVHNSGTGYLRVWPVGGTEPTAAALHHPHPPNTAGRSAPAAARSPT
jgi:hypothetical protein